MNSEIPEVVCDASYELVIKRRSAVKYELESYVRRQLLPPFQFQNTNLFLALNPIFPARNLLF